MLGIGARTAGCIPRTLDWGDEMLSCKEFALIKKKKIKDDVIEVKSGVVLHIIQVGDNQASNKYIRGKIKDCEEVGITVKLTKFSESVSEADVISAISHHSFDGVIVQLPIPEHISIEKVIDSIPCYADVDGFKVGTSFTPCTAKGIMMYLDECGVEFSGKNAVVIGRSEIVGKPIARLLLDRDCTVTMCHSKTKCLFEHTKNADIIIVAAGKEGLLTGDMISTGKNPIVVDVGINVGNDGKLVGDCDYESLKDNCSILTPVPGGVGLLTRLALLDNVVEAARNNEVKVY